MKNSKQKTQKINLGKRKIKPLRMKSHVRAGIAYCCRCSCACLE